MPGAPMTKQVIILGAARSGTKFLRDVLGASQFVRRVPHDVNYVWRRGNHTHPHDEIPASLIDDETAAKIRGRLHALASTRGTIGEILVEKTVSNCLRVALVDRVLPDAKFVHLVRDGREVTESAIRQWQAPADRSRLADKFRTLSPSDTGYVAWYLKNQLASKIRHDGGIAHWGPRYDGMGHDVETEPLAVVCARQWRRSVTLATDALAEVDPFRVHTVRYEDLIADSVAITRLAEFCELGDVDQILDRYEQAVDRNSGPRWRALSESDQLAMSSELTPTLADLGYYGGDQTVGAQPDGGRT